MKYSQRLNRHYAKLWKDAGVHSSRRIHERPDKATTLIDEICFRADLCETSEGYIQALCEGMIFLIQSNVPLKSIETHRIIKQKIHALPEDILNNSRQGTDQFYVGLFAKLKLKTDWLSVKFYQIIQKMMHHVLEQGLKISPHIKQKIEQQIKQLYPELYSLFFVSNKLSSSF